MKTWFGRVLTILGVVAVTLGLLAGVVNREVLDGDRFARHVDAVRSDPDVARQVGLLVTDEVLKQQPADVVNAKSVLFKRLKTCQTERGHIPNYVAVNNYDRGDLVATVEALNGVG